MELNIHSFESIDKNQDLLFKLEHLAKILADNGISVKALRNDQQKQKLSTLSYLDLQRISAAFLPYFDLLQFAREENISINSNKTLTEFLVKSNEWTLCEDILDKIEPDDIVEVYNLNVKPIFRSINYFKFTGYSLYEIFSSDFWQMYERENKITQALANKRGILLRQEEKQTLAADVDEHIVKEKFSESMKSYLVEQKWLSPIFDKEGNTQAVLRTFKILKEVTN